MYEIASGVNINRYKFKYLANITKSWEPKHFSYGLEAKWTKQFTFWLLFPAWWLIPVLE